MTDWSELRKAESFLRHGVRGPEAVRLADALMDEYDRRGAAIQRVQELCRPGPHGLLNKALFAREVLAALDGDTTEEKR